MEPSLSTVTGVPAGPRHDTTVDGVPSQIPPSITTCTESENAARTSAAVVRGASRWRLALVTASGPLRESLSPRRGPLVTESIMEAAQGLGIFLGGESALSVGHDVVDLALLGPHVAALGGAFSVS